MITKIRLNNSQDMRKRFRVRTFAGVRERSYLILLSTFDNSSAYNTYTERTV